MTTAAIELPGTQPWVEPPSQRAGKVLILGTDSRVVLAIARSLGRRGLQVHVGWCARGSLARHSKYLGFIHELPVFDPSTNDWKIALRLVLEVERFDLVIPCNDSTTVPLHQFRHEFATFPEITFLNPTAFSVAFSKFETYRLARLLDVSVPRGGVVENLATALRLAERIGYPLVIKPRSTVTVESCGRSRVVHKVHSPLQLRSIWEAGDWSDGALLQECVIGTGVGVELLAKHGEIRSAFQHARIHQTMEYGSSYRKSVEVDPRLFEAARRLMAALDYTGVAMVEFIVDESTGNWWMLEINGRFWGSLPLAVAAGADFPYYLYRLWVEGADEFPADYRRGVHCRNLTLDFEAVMRECRARGLGFFARVRYLLRAARGLFALRDHLDSFAWDDPRPGLREFGEIFRRLCGKARGQVVGRSSTPEG